MRSEKELKAAAVIDFVDVMIGALESGCVDKNNPTLSEIHQFARMHVKDNYGAEYADIAARWDEDVAELCGGGEVS